MQPRLTTQSTFFNEKRRDAGGRFGTLARRSAALLAVAALAGCNADRTTAPAAAARHAGSGAQHSVSAEGFSTAGPSTYTVPAGVTSLIIDAVGGGGGGSLVYPGGSGAHVTATVAVTPGQVLDLFVGGSTTGTNWSVGGGGATTVMSGGTPLVIAGGGGGAGRDRSGGSAGGAGGAGGDGVSGGTVSCGRRCSTVGTGGLGGAGGVGGAGGASSGGWPAGSTGGSGNGGAGGTGGGVGPNGGGAGGDGGYYGGGGGGGYGGGGGGGSGSGGGAGGSFGPAGATFEPAGNGGLVGQAGGIGSITITPAVPLDNTPPVITPTVTGTTGLNGWYTSDVSVTWSVTDAESAVKSQSGCDAASVTTDTAGQTFTCTATSDGGTSSQSVTIKRDATKPAIGYTPSSASYTVDQTVSITCAASDAMSGLASSTCANISGDAYTFDLGANTRSATAQDNAGNTNSASVTFTVSVTSGSLCSLVRRFVSNGGVQNSMCVKLGHGDYAPFINEVQAQSGKQFLSAPNADILIRLATTLM